MARIRLALTGGLAPGEIVECVQLAEALGYESVWMEEGHGGDQFAILMAPRSLSLRARPNQGLEPTASSLRCASASGRLSPSERKR